MMESSLILAIVVAIVTILVYATLSRGLFRATDPARQSLIEISGRLLAPNNGLPGRHKRSIESALDEVHSALDAWLLALIAVIVLFAYPFLGHGKKPAFFKDIPKRHMKDYDRFMGRYFFATMGNSLGAALVFGIAVGLTVAYARSLKAVSRTILDWHDNNGNGPSLKPQHS